MRKEDLVQKIREVGLMADESGYELISGSLYDIADELDEIE